MLMGTNGQLPIAMYQLKGQKAQKTVTNSKRVEHTVLPRRAQS
jgi:hypothetical protein